MSNQRRSFRKPPVTALCAALTLAACAKNPVTGRYQPSLISEKQEISMGLKAHNEVTSTMGLYKNEQLQAYVNEIGQKMAKQSERPNLPWTFGVIDDASVNAFALPGGYIYVTRGMLTHLNSEAELAAVLGHEIGHVTARHSVSRVSSAQLAQIGLLAGMILKPEFQRYGNLAQLGMGLMFLKYSRDDERQADKLGLRYMTHSSYSGPAMVEVFTLLKHVGEQEKHGRLPNWLATHPEPEDRIKKTLTNIDKLGPQNDALLVERDAYLRRIDGVLYGHNPREGFFDGNAFHHPDMKFTAMFPPGWQTSNQKQGVSAISPRQDAIVQISLARGTNPRDAANQFLSQPGLRTDQPQALDMNGLPAVGSRFMAQSQNQMIGGLSLFVAHEGKVFQILAYSSAQQWPAYERMLGQSLGSFQRLTDPKALAVQPQFVKIVKLDRGVSVAQLAKETSSDLPLEKLALINQVASDSQLEPGHLAKSVVAARPPKTPASPKNDSLNAQSSSRSESSWTVPEGYGRAFD